MPITNPAIKKLPSDGGQAIAKYLGIIWQAIVILGGLFVLLYLAWGALDWILSGSDPERLKRAKDKIFNSIFGLVILALSYLIIKLVGLFLGIDILNPDWPTF
jgi:hypothetical protein